MKFRKIIINELNFNYYHVEFKYNSYNNIIIWIQLLILLPYPRENKPILNEELSMRSSWMPHVYLVKKGSFIDTS